MLKHYGYDVCLELAEGASVVSYQWTIPELRNIALALKYELELLEKEHQQKLDDFSGGR
jgi:hypothetical protein